VSHRQPRCKSRGRLREHRVPIPRAGRGRGGRPGAVRGRGRARPVALEALEGPEGPDAHDSVSEGEDGISDDGDGADVETVLVDARRLDLSDSEPELDTVDGWAVLEDHKETRVSLEVANLWFTRPKIHLASKAMPP
jgi:hypothetical protein